MKRVSFRGSEHPQTGDLCLLRCAEASLENGCSYFQVVDSESGNVHEPISSPYPFHRHYLAEDRFFHDFPVVTKTIRMLKDQPDEDFAYDAHEVRRAMRRKYELD